MRTTHRRAWLAGVVAVVTALGGSAFAFSAAEGGTGQPPPGTSSDPGPIPPLGGQPPAGASAQPSGADFVLGSQPANRHPRPGGKPTQVSGPDERGDGGDGGSAAFAGRTDSGGVNGADRPGGRSDG